MNQQIDSKREIFISYSRADENIVSKIIQGLKTNGISDSNIFIDRNIHGTTRFTNELAGAILNCKVVLFLVSKQSSTSDWVRKEVAFAIQNKKPVYPIYLDESKLDSELEFELIRVNSIKIDHYNFNKSIAVIIDTLVGIGIQNNNPLSTSNIRTNNNDSSRKTIVIPYKYIVLILIFFVVLLGKQFWKSNGNSEVNREFFTTTNDKKLTISDKNLECENIINYFLHKEFYYEKTLVTYSYMVDVFKENIESKGVKFIGPTCNYRNDTYILSYHALGRTNEGKEYDHFADFSIDIKNEQIKPISSLARSMAPFLGL